MNGLTQRFTCFLFVLEVMAFVMSTNGERRMEKENKVLFALMLAVFAIVACAFIMFDDGDVSAAAYRLLCFRFDVFSVLTEIKITGNLHFYPSSLSRTFFVIKPGSVYFGSDGCSA